MIKKFIVLSLATLALAIPVASFADTAEIPNNTPTCEISFLDASIDEMDLLEKDGVVHSYTYKELWNAKGLDVISFNHEGDSGYLNVPTGKHYNYSYTTVAFSNPDGEYKRIRLDSKVSNFQVDYYATTVKIVHHYELED